MNTTRRVLFALCAAALTAFAAAPPQAIVVDIQRPTQPFALRSAAGTEPLIRAVVKNGGTNYPTAGWTGTLFWARSLTATQVVAIRSTAVSSNVIDFAVPASALATTGTLFAQLVLSDGASSVEWARGSWKVDPSPGTYGAAQTNFAPVMNWDLIGSYIGTPPWTDSTNGFDSVALTESSSNWAVKVGAQLRLWTRTNYLTSANLAALSNSVIAVGAVASGAVSSLGGSYIVANDQGQVPWSFAVVPFDNAGLPYFNGLGSMDFGYKSTGVVYGGHGDLSLHGGGYQSSYGSNNINVFLPRSENADFGLFRVLVGDYDNSPALVGAIGSAGFIGNGARLTNLNASALASGTLPAEILGTNIARTMGGLSTTGTVTAASFVGDGSMLTNLDNPFTNFYNAYVPGLTNRIAIAVPSNSAWGAIEVSSTAFQTNDASQGYYYFRLNGATGTNVLHAYQTMVANNTTISGASGSNDASGAYAGRIYSPHNYSNAVSTLRLDIMQIYDPYPAKPYTAVNFAKPRTGAGLAQQYSEDNRGTVSLGGVVTQIEIIAVGTMFDTGTVFRARGMPQ